MIPPKSASRLRFSQQKQRENHRQKQRIWFYDQPPAKSGQELFDNIADGSVCQYLTIYPSDCRWNWNLIVVRFDSIDGWADVWTVCLGLDNKNPSVTFLVTRSEIAGTVRHLFRLASKCRVKLPVGHYYMISPAAVDALLAAEALAGAILR